MEQPDSQARPAINWRNCFSNQFSAGLTAIAAVCALVVFCLFRAYVPLNMDEYVSYQTLACLWHPHSGENVFCNSCADFYLRVVGGFKLPLLTYDYIGSLSSLLYAPFYFLWPSPMSARITGMIALLVQAAVLARMFRFRTPVVFCALLLFFPYSFPNIADTGPVAFQTTSVVIVCYLLRRWILSRHWQRRAPMMAGAGFLIALGCWVKPAYFFASCGLAITALAGFLLALRRRSHHWAIRNAEYLLLFCCAAIPTLFVYEAHHLGGGGYLPIATTDFLPRQVVLDGIGQRFCENVLHFVIHPIDVTSMYYFAHLDHPARDLAFCILGCVISLGGIARPGISFRWRSEIVLNCGLFVLSLFLVATNIYAKSMHHTVLAYPFLLLAAGRSLQAWRRSRVFQAMLALFLILAGSLFLWFPVLLTEARHNADPKPFVAQLNDDLNRDDADGSVIACVDWGIYFVKALYGPRSEVVLSLCLLDDQERLQQSAAIARRLHRNLTVVGLRDNRRLQELLRSTFSDIEERPERDPDNPWRIWRIPNGKLNNPQEQSPSPGIPASAATSAP